MTDEQTAAAKSSHDGHMIAKIRVPRRFNGPPASANGGYVAGLLATYLSGSVEVTLLRPPPLERSLELRRTGTGVSLFDGAERLAEATPSPLELETPHPVTASAAARASVHYSGFEHHVFPTCFVCGPERTPGDGLRIFPGPLEVAGSEGSPVAAPWTPSGEFAGENGDVHPEVIWAALDCPGAFAIGQPEDRIIVLGRMTCRIERPVKAREEHVVVAWPLGTEGRKHGAGSAILDSRGRTCAVARAVWIAPRG